MTNDVDLRSETSVVGGNATFPRVYRRDLHKRTGGIQAEAVTDGVSPPPAAAARGEHFSIREESVSTQVQTETTHERRKHGDSQRDMSRVGLKKQKKKNKKRSTVPSDTQTEA